jgi:hypothetical protein
MCRDVSLHANIIFKDDVLKREKCYYYLVTAYFKEELFVACNASHALYLFPQGGICKELRTCNYAVITCS